MNNKRVVPYRVIGLLIVAILMFWGASLTFAKPQTQLTMSISPTSGYPGTVVTVIGSGWTGNTSENEIRWDSKTGPILRTFSTNPNGAFTTSITIPSGASAGEYKIFTCDRCNSINPQMPTLWTLAKFQVIIPPTSTLPPPPTPTDVPTVCDPTGAPGEFVIDFEDLPTDTNLRGSTITGGITLVGDYNMFVFRPTVDTRSPRQALNMAQTMEFGSINIPMRISFSDLKEFVGVFVGLEEQIWADMPITATLTAKGYACEPNEDGHFPCSSSILGVDSVTFGPEATPIQECLSISGPYIFEITIDYGVFGEPEAIDDLVLRGPEEPIPVPEDDSPPVVTIAQPEEGVRIAEEYLRIQGEITEDRELERVDVLLNGDLYRAIGFTPAGNTESGDRLYLFALDGIPVSEMRACEESTITVRAYDGSGLEGFNEVTFIVQVGDLQINAAEPVQVVYDAPLVENKGTAFRVQVSSTFACAIDAKFQLILPESEWSVGPPRTGLYHTGVPPSWDYPEIWGPVTIPAEAYQLELMLPYIQPGDEAHSFDLSIHPSGVIEGVSVSGVRGPDVRVVPRPLGSNVSFTVIVDPENQISETDEFNNQLDAGTFDVVRTRGWKFLLVPYFQESSACSPSMASLEGNLKDQIEYLLATYPIADTKVSYATALLIGEEECRDSDTCGWSMIWTSEQGRGSFLNDATALARSFGYDFAIGIGCGGGGGTVLMHGGAVAVGEGSGISVLAHEFNHAVVGIEDIYSLDCLVSWDEAYCERPDGTRVYCCQSDEYGKPDGFVQPNCSYDEAGEVVCEEQEKICIESCGCSLYRRENPSGESDCLATDAEGEYLIEDTCNAGCCAGICRGICPGGGPVFTGPDARITHPASDGFWVNQWIHAGESNNYFMDIPTSGPFPGHWMRLYGTSQHCTGTAFNDGMLNMLADPSFLSEIDPPVLMVRGTIDRTGRAYFGPFLYMPESNLDLAPDSRGDYYIVLLDTSGQVLSRSGFTPSFEISDPNGGPLDEVPFIYRVQWRDDTQRIELRDQTGKVLASRDVSQYKPEVHVVSPTGGEQWEVGKTYTLCWDASDLDGDSLLYSIAISEDGGKNWLPLVTNLVESQYELITKNLREGEEYLFLVRATDGVNTSEDTSDNVFSITAGRTRIPMALALGGIGLLAALGCGLLIVAALRWRK